MSTTFLELQNEVKDIIDDTTQDVSSYVNRSFSFISQFFQNKTVSEFNPSQEATYLDTPTQLNRIVSIFVNGVPIARLDDDEIEKIELAKEDSVQRFISVTSLKIYLTFTVKTTDDVEIVYYKNYTQLSADGDVTDVPDIYLPLLISCSVWLFYEKLVSAVITNREKYPDVNPREVSKIRDSLKKEFDDMLVNFQIEQ